MLPVLATVMLREPLLPAEKAEAEAFRMRPEAMLVTILRVAGSALRVSVKSVFWKR
jgi:hypothetical protein